MEEDDSEVENGEVSDNVSVISNPHMCYNCSVGGGGRAIMIQPPKCASPT